MPPKKKGTKRKASDDLPCSRQSTRGSHSPTSLRKMARTSASESRVEVVTPRRTTRHQAGPPKVTPRKGGLKRKPSSASNNPREPKRPKPTADDGDDGDEPNDPEEEGNQDQETGDKAKPPAQVPTQKAPKAGAGATGTTGRSRNQKLNQVQENYMIQNLVNVDRVKNWPNHMRNLNQLKDPGAEDFSVAQFQNRLKPIKSKHRDQTGGATAGATGGKKGGAGGKAAGAKATDKPGKDEEKKAKSGSKGDEAGDNDGGGKGGDDGDDDDDGDDGDDDNGGGGAQPKNDLSKYDTDLKDCPVKWDNHPITNVINPQERLIFSWYRRWDSNKKNQRSAGKVSERYSEYVKDTGEKYKNKETLSAEGLRKNGGIFRRIAYRIWYVFGRNYMVEDVTEQVQAYVPPDQEKEGKGWPEEMLSMPPPDLVQRLHEVRVQAQPADDESDDEAEGVQDEQGVSEDIGFPTEEDQPANLQSPETDDEESEAEVPQEEPVPRAPGSPPRVTSGPREQRSRSVQESSKSGKTPSRTGEKTTKLSEQSTKSRGKPSRSGREQSKAAQQPPKSGQRPSQLAQAQSEHEQVQVESESAPESAPESELWQVEPDELPKLDASEQGYHNDHDDGLTERVQDDELNQFLNPAGPLPENARVPRASVLKPEEGQEDWKYATWIAWSPKSRKVGSDLRAGFRKYGFVSLFLVDPKVPEPSRQLWITDIPWQHLKDYSGRCRTWAASLDKARRKYGFGSSKDPMFQSLSLTANPQTVRRYVQCISPQLRQALPLHDFHAVPRSGTSEGVVIKAQPIKWSPWDLVQLYYFASWMGTDHICNIVITEWFQMHCYADEVRRNDRIAPGWKSEVPEDPVDALDFLENGDAGLLKLSKVWSLAKKNVHDPLVTFLTDYFAAFPKLMSRFTGGDLRKAVLRLELRPLFAEVKQKMNSKRFLQHVKRVEDEDEDENENDNDPHELCRRYHRHPPKHSPCDKIGGSTNLGSTSEDDKPDPSAPYWSKPRGVRDVKIVKYDEGPFIIQNRLGVSVRAFNRLIQRRDDWNVRRLKEVVWEYVPVYCRKCIRLRQKTQGDKEALPRPNLKLGDSKNFAKSREYRGADDKKRDREPKGGLHGEGSFHWYVKPEWDGGAEGIRDPVQRFLGYSDDDFNDFVERLKRQNPHWNQSLLISVRRAPVPKYFPDSERPTGGKDSLKATRMGLPDQHGRYPNHLNWRLKRTERAPSYEIEKSEINLEDPQAAPIAELALNNTMVSERRALRFFFYGSFWCKPISVPDEERYVDSDGLIDEHQCMRTAKGKPDYLGGKYYRVKQRKAIFGLRTRTRPSEPESDPERIPGRLTDERKRFYSYGSDDEKGLMEESDWDNDPDDDSEGSEGEQGMENQGEEEDGDGHYEGDYPENPEVDDLFDDTTTGDDEELPEEEAADDGPPYPDLFKSRI